MYSIVENFNSILLVDFMIFERKDSFLNLSIGFSVLYGILLLISALFPSPFFWGVRVVEFVPIHFTVIAFLVLSLSFIQPVRSIVISTVDGFVQKVQNQSFPIRYSILALIVVLIGLLFWHFRQSLFFLGDGYLLIGSLVHVNWYSDIHIFYKNEPLPGLIFVSLDKLTLLFNHESSAQFSIQFASILFGIGSVYVAFKIFRQFTNNLSAAFFALACFLSAATSQIYFGYVENYSPPIFFLLVFLFAGIRFLTTGNYYIAVVISYTILFFSHYSMLSLFPAFIVLSLKMVKEKKIVEMLLSIILGLIVLMVLISITYYPRTLFFERFLNTSAHFLPLFNDDNISFSYSLLSLKHIADILNHYIFVFPFLIPFSALLFKRNHHSKLWLDQRIKFIIIAMVCAIVFGFIAKSELGLSRDWDLFSLFLIPAILFIIIAILKTEDVTTQKNIFIIIILTTFAHTGTWIFINSNKEKAFEYFKSLPNEELWSKKSNANAHSELARYYEQLQNYDRSLFHYQEYVKYDPTNSRIWENIGGTYFYVLKDTANAKKAYEKCVEYGRNSWVVFANLGEIYLRQNRLDSALELVNHSLMLNPNNDDAKKNRSLILERMARK